MGQRKDGGDEEQGGKLSMDRRIGCSLLDGNLTPVAVIDPSIFLTVLAAIFGAPAASTLGKLASIFLPFATLIVRTLADPSTRVVFAAQISHHYAGPILHILRVMTYGKFLDQREDVEIVGQQILFGNGFIQRQNVSARSIVVQQLQFGTDLQLGNEVRSLKIGTEVAVLGYISQELQRHEYVFVPQCRRQDARRSVSIEQEARVSVGWNGWWRQAGDDMHRGRRRGQPEIRVGIGIAVSICHGSIDDTTIETRSMGDIECFDFRPVGTTRSGQVQRRGNRIEHGILVVGPLNVDTRLDINHGLVGMNARGGAFGLDALPDAIIRITRNRMLLTQRRPSPGSGVHAEWSRYRCIGCRRRFRL